MRVLVTEISGPKGISICRALHGVPGITLYTSDPRSYTRSIRSRYAGEHRISPSPEKDPKAWLAFMETFVREKEIDILLPVNSEEYRLLLPAKERLGRSLSYMGPADTYFQLDDKSRLARLIRELGLPAPATYAAASDVTHFPVVVKPVLSSGSKGVIYAENKKQLSDAVRHDPNAILQEYVEGFGAGYSVLCQNGRILAGSGHKRLAETPISGGSSTIRSWYEHPEMIATVKRITAHLSYSGLAMFEFRISHDENKVWLIEVNPRVWGSIHQSIASGVNFPLLLCQPDTPIQIDRNARTYLSPLHLESLAGYLFKKGRLAPAIDFIRHYLRSQPDVSLANDPAGYLSLLLRRL